MLTTDAKILYAHYLAGRYPDSVPVGLPDDLQEFPAERIAECCTARALGARDAKHFDDMEHHLPSACSIAELVGKLLSAEVSQ